ncbi:MAG: ABC-type spermidine/putrescine transport system, ATPase component [uncultured archaeon A07HB70]|nr:MAG: ABC-type spermidine/putrescine transport system, ATPase component [uncultured archaeon A07HB70]
MAPTPKPVRLDGLRVAYGETVAVGGVDLSVAPGELFCLLGPSGCGKTTTLRAVAGLTDPTAGRVVVGDEDVTDRPPARRDTSMVFQDWALFPRKTALENVAFGPKMAGADRETRHERARDLLETVEVADHAGSYPDELSGGQKQRVALARSLAVDPGVLLLDEPLSSLDKRLRQRLQRALGDLHDRVETTMLHVTHDQDEAFTLGDRVGVMRDGRLLQVGTPREVYDQPRTRFVEEFLGETTVLEGPVVEGAVRTPLGDLPLPTGGDGGPVAVSVRPTALDLVPATETDSHDQRTDAVRSDGDGRAAGQVSDVLYRGTSVRYYVAVAGAAGSVEPFAEYSARTDPGFERGDRVALRWRPSDLRFFGPAGERLCR